MEKEFVPYALAVELKELGFDEPCLSCYDEEKTFEYDAIPNNQNLLQGFVSSPTFSQAFRWFREKHNLMFQIYYLRNGNHSVIIHKTTPEYMDIVDQLQLSSGCVGEVVDCYSYEQAELECLKKLIEIVKKQK